MLKTKELLDKLREIINRDSSRVKLSVYEQDSFDKPLKVFFVGSSNFEFASVWHAEDCEAKYLLNEVILNNILTYKEIEKVRLLFIEYAETPYELRGASQEDILKERIEEFNYEEKGRASHEFKATNRDSYIVIDHIINFTNPKRNEPRLFAENIARIFPNGEVEFKKSSIDDGTKVEIFQTCLDYTKGVLEW